MSSPFARAAQVVIDAQKGPTPHAKIGVQSGPTPAAFVPIMAVGWMLREVCKRDQPTLEDFLGEHYSIMPRTMLRDAIERFPINKRQAYLNGLV
jgi:hypothetical protein